MRNGERVNWIDALKGIAMCGVLMIHTGGGNLPSFIGKIGKIGYSGVQLFFIISAYLAYASLENKFKREREKMQLKEIFKWQIRKIIKLVPLYYLALVIFTCLGGSSYWYGSENGVTVWNFFAHLFFLHGLFPHYADSIIGVEWYLGVLAIFYLVVPYLYKWINCFEKAIILFVSSVFVGNILSDFMYEYIPLNTADSYIYVNYVKSFCFIKQFPILCCGIFIYYVINSEFLMRIKNKKIISYFTLLFSVIMIVGQAYEKNVLWGIPTIVLFAIWFSLIIVSQELHASKVVCNRLFCQIGKKAYGIYLYHMLIIKIYDVFGKQQNDSGLMDWLIKFILCISISYIISGLLEKFVNKPINTYFEKRCGI